MKIGEEMERIQNVLEKYSEGGCTYKEIEKLENKITEMVNISKWFEKQCNETSKILSNKGACANNQYIRLLNTTGYNFKYFSVEMQVYREEHIVNRTIAATIDWKNGEYSNLYFDNAIGELDVLSIMPENISYELK